MDSSHSDNEETATHENPHLSASDSRNPIQYIRRCGYVPATSSLYENKKGGIITKPFYTNTLCVRGFDMTIQEWYRLIKWLIVEMIRLGFMDMDLAGYGFEFKSKDWFLTTLWVRHEVCRSTDVPAAWKEEMLRGLMRKAKRFYDKNPGLVLDDLPDPVNVVTKERWRIHKSYQWHPFTGIFQIQHMEIVMIHRPLDSPTSFHTSVKATDIMTSPPTTTTDQDVPADLLSFSLLKAKMLLLPGLVGDARTKATAVQRLGVYWQKEAAGNIILISSDRGLRAAMKTGRKENSSVITFIVQEPESMTNVPGTPKPKNKIKRRAATENAEGSVGASPLAKRARFKKPKV
ncbi:hypothetical protein HBI70_165590 [Parastagonospora nodorum]|nr:hypothetical protein HBH95_142810 [Parastagonospora nodorum]KAH5260583.1 hypothetical protein HBI70_165590 [Parastagonospora nodorum]